ncbi:ATP synthase F1 subunit delta [Botrimarina mediterranea]|uniref:ATP synthase subunit delta n=1 Tax=Botrimarina mediterranea TaxID=2528022 RepID=A0A518K6Y0_9BACT|nr:ATP synthase F1 subunit delta [Botrimarina mediterranea]QDV73545.1 ATP synthase subunit delta, sodium ion specific [Botrimarina mediterranea]QDV78136.1 ATP synthase subunit delta, sodium ion specific [Planctomycetes bacterium K2D]
MATESRAPKHETVMDVTAERIARTYAQGFLGAAGDDESVVADLEAVQAEVFAQHPQFAEAMRSAFVDHDVRVGMIDRVLGGRVAPVVVTLLKVLSDHDRMELVGEVARQARKLYEESNNRARVVIRLAHAVDDGLLKEIEDTIRQASGFEPIVSVEIDPDLVGGLEVRVGDKVYDGSVRTAFAKAHKAIVNQTVAAIESQPQRFTLAD